LPSSTESDASANTADAKFGEVIIRSNAPSAYVDAANEVKDMIEQYFPHFAAIKRKAVGLDVELKYMHAQQMSRSLFLWAFQLLKGNMREMYDRCKDWGWEDKVKSNELQDLDARYIFAFDRSSQKPVGFVHLRYIVEQDMMRQLYVYEIQVEKHMTGKGLGSELMKLVEKIAWKFNFHRVMLTVFKDNEGAIRFYAKLGYAIDASDPSNFLENESGSENDSENDANQDCGYCILSKIQPPKPKKKKKKKKKKKPTQTSADAAHDDAGDADAGDADAGDDDNDNKE
jgi:N-alpha-acetyltransferase 40